MVRRFIGLEEVKKTRKTAQGGIMVKLQDPSTRKMRRVLMTPKEYGSKIRYEES